LTQWATYAHEQLNLDSDATVIEQVFLRALAVVTGFPHATLVAVALVAYAALEGTEGVGLALRKRWAEYLTVLATAILIPFEVYEVIHKATLFRVGALLLNLAVVGYLAYTKRLFVGV
jgi:uncharacterized membrane protein (DUF2068 family)